MSKNIGTLVTAAIRPNDSLDLIASAYANEIMGGLHRATASTDRDSIIEARREWGMMCYVIDQNKLYQLSYNKVSTSIIDNRNWVQFTGGGNGSVIHLDADTSNGYGYTASGSNIITSYSKDALYIVNFKRTNTGSGASASLNIDSLGEKSLKKTSGSSLTNIITGDLTTNYQYYITYNGTYFELLNPGGGSSSGLSNKYYIDSTETVTVPSSNQYWIYGDLTIDGTLDNYGQVVVVNGNLQTTGNFNIYGTYSNIYFAEIDGQGQENYVPRWKSSYVLTASSSIYDDTNQVIISSPTFSVSNNFILPKGATSGYVLTSDSNGVATWQKGVNKYTGTFSFPANATQSITHGLNSKSIIFNFWNEDTGLPATVNVYKSGLNTIDVMSTVAVVNGRVVIIS